MDRPLPEDMVERLSETQPDALLAVLSSIPAYGDQADALLLRLSEHPDMDVSCAALRLLAARGTVNPKIAAVLVLALRGGQEPKVLAVLESLDATDLPSPRAAANWDAESRPPGPAPADPPAEILDLFLGTTEPGGAEDPAEVAADSAAENVLSAFLAPSPSAEQAPPAIAADDVLSSFLSPPATDGAAPAPPVLVPNAAGELAQWFETYAGDSYSPRVRAAASLLSCGLGQTHSLQYLNDRLPELTTHQRVAIGRALAARLSPEALPLAARLLRTPSSEVRKESARALIRNLERQAAADTLFSAVLDPDGRLTEAEILDNYQLVSKLGESGVRTIVHPWIEALAARTNDPPAQVLALSMAEMDWHRGHELMVERLMRSPHPYVRRAAFHAWGRAHPAGLNPEQVAALLSDPAELVRQTLPAAYTQESLSWIRYLDEFTSVQSYLSVYNRPNRGKPLPDYVRDALTQLSADPSPKVRIEAALALLYNFVPVDLHGLLATARSFPDREPVAERIAEYLEAHYQRLGPPFVALLRYVEEVGNAQLRNRASMAVAYDQIADVYRHFGVSPPSEETPPELQAVEVTGRRQTASFLPAGLSSTPAPARQALRLLFFYEPGCDACEEVEYMLDTLSPMFPELEVVRHSILLGRGESMLSALSEQFGVPRDQRRLTPTVFAQGGFLVRDDISPDRLADLLGRTLALEESDWIPAPPLEPTPVVASAPAPSGRRATSTGGPDPIALLPWITVVAMAGAGLCAAGIRRYAR